MPMLAHLALRRDRAAVAAIVDEAGRRWAAAVPTPSSEPAVVGALVAALPADRTGPASAAVAAMAAAHVRAINAARSAGRPVDGADVDGAVAAVVAALRHDAGRLTLAAGREAALRGVGGGAADQERQHRLRRNRPPVLRPGALPRGSDGISLGRSRPR